MTVVYLEKDCELNRSTRRNMTARREIVGETAVGYLGIAGTPVNAYGHTSYFLVNFQDEVYILIV